MKKVYTCDKCKKECNQLNWSFELSKWICNDCEFKTPAPIRKEPKEIKYVLR